MASLIGIVVFNNLKPVWLITRQLYPTLGWDNPLQGGLINQMDRALPLAVDRQLQHIWPGVVPCRVKVLPLLAYQVVFDRY